MSYHKHSIGQYPHLGNNKISPCTWLILINVLWVRPITPQDILVPGEEPSFLESPALTEQANQLNESMGEVSVSTDRDIEADESNVQPIAADADADAEIPEEQETADSDDSPVSEPSPSSTVSGKQKTKNKKSLSTTSATRRRDSKAHDYIIAMVGKECIAHSDVVKRLNWMEKISHHTIDNKVYSKVYHQTLLQLVQEARHRQNIIRLRKIVKEGYQNNETPFLKEKFLHHYTSELLSKNFVAPLEELKKKLGDLFPTLYRMWFARVLAMISVRALYSKELEAPSESAIKSQMKRDELLRKEVWYRTKEIVIYNHHGQWSVSNNPLITARQMLDDGVPFSQLAQQWSESPSHVNQGECPWRPLSAFPKPMQQFLVQASIGDVSPIVTLPSHHNPQQFIMHLLCEVQRPENQSKLSQADKRQHAMKRIMDVKFARCQKKMNTLLQRLYPCKIMSRDKKFGR